MPITLVMTDDDAFHHFRTGADETVVLDDGGRGLQRLQHPADAGAAGQVAMLADLRARTDRGPGVDHGALAHMRADVDEAGHQHHVLAEIAAAPRHRTGHNAHAQLAELGLIEIGEARFHLVPERRRIGLHQLHLVDAEIQQHRLLQTIR